MRRTDLQHVTLDGRHAGELLAHPCNCGQQHSLGDHIWQSTTDMTPGPKAQSFEPPTARPNVIPIDGDPPPDTTSAAHDEYKRLLTGYRNYARDLTRFIDAHRPDRWMPLPEPATDDQWCSHHLEIIGTCEPRYRGDLCRWCYDIGLAYNQLPDIQLMRAKHERGYTRAKDMADWQDRQPKSKRRKSRNHPAGYRT